MAGRPQPRVSATLSLEPRTHSFSSTHAPNLNITLILDHHEPITIYADDLSPSLMITRGAFRIHYRSSGAEIQQSIRTLCRIPPPSKATVNLNEDLFHTLLPHTPYTISAPFTRKRKDDKPCAGSDPMYSNGSSPPPLACGVDGLEPGYDYILSLAPQPRVHWRQIRWWEYGTKESVLYLGQTTNQLSAREVMFGTGPHDPIEIDTSSISFVEFRCEE